MEIEKPKKKTGRPKAPESRILRHIVQIRFKDSHFAKIKQKADEEDIDVSTYLRFQIKKFLKL